MMMFAKTYEEVRSALIGDWKVIGKQGTHRQILTKTEGQDEFVAAIRCDGPNAWWVYVSQVNAE